MLFHFGDGLKKQQCYYPFIFFGYNRVAKLRYGSHYLDVIENFIVFMQCSWRDWWIVTSSLKSKPSCIDLSIYYGVPSMYYIAHLQSNHANSKQWSFRSIIFFFSELALRKEMLFLMEQVLCKFAAEM